MREDYPVIIIPEAFRRWKFYLPQLQYSKPSPPQKPEKPTHPKVVPKPNKSNNFIWLVIIFLISLFGTIIIGLMAKNIWSIIFSFIGLFGPISCYCINRQKSYYQEQLDKYKQNQRNLKIYPKKLAKWKKSEQQYGREQSEYQRVLELYNAQQNEFNYYMLQAQKQFSKIKVTKPYSKQNSRRGQSEGFFLSYLKDCFPGKIYTDLALLKKGWSEEYAYLPDFIYYDSDWNIYIDIEIDEPYDKKHRKPRHYIGLNKEQIRNEFFRQNNWIIIRFAEKQVVRYPDSCCKKIAEVIQSLIPLSLPENLKDVKPLENITRWSYEDAKKMADNGNRDKYL